MESKKKSFCRRKLENTRTFLRIHGPSYYVIPQTHCMKSSNTPKHNARTPPFHFSPSCIPKSETCSTPTRQSLQVRLIQASHQQ
ncbi:hypothetical protein EUGRSUZ_C03253 [Eucalyptus grandis]|uniref:Uncharacterized protein n=2 Tax=Eucalyptus grandis TaxID=71139 RepID=A0ACC3LI14_EUCGR|nr:hypothetical protein EUGRSUZ_C03253 [Eucalyptus grandis]